jgi:hypothetical protein
MADIRQFSAESQQRIANAVRKVERSPILRPQPFVRTTSPIARELRWARTTTSLEFPSYPDSGNAVVVEFGDYAISGSPIVSSTNTPSFTAYDPEQQVVALMSSGTLPTQGSVVQCYRHEGQWWIKQVITGDIVRVKNTTGSTLSAGAVLELTTCVTTPTRYAIVLNGIARAGVDPPCAVLLADATNNEIVDATTSGVCVANVDIIDADNTHARVVPGDTQLKGDFGGWARIIYKPTGTGVKSCVLHVGETRTVRRKARATTTVTDGSTGSADIYIENVACSNVTVHYNWMTGAGNIANGSDLFIEYFHDEDKWVVVGAECAA